MHKYNFAVVFSNFRTSQKCQSSRGNEIFPSNLNEHLSQHLRCKLEQSRSTSNKACIIRVAASVAEDSQIQLYPRISTSDIFRKDLN